MLPTIVKQNRIILDLLVNIKIEQEALRNIVVRHIVETDKLDINELNQNYNQDREEAKALILAQIKAHYELDDTIDDLLSSALK